MCGNRIRRGTRTRKEKKRKKQRKSMIDMSISPCLDGITVIVEGMRWRERTFQIPVSFPLVNRPKPILSFLPTLPSSLPTVLLCLPSSSPSPVEISTQTSRTPPTHPRLSPPPRSPPVPPFLLASLTPSCSPLNAPFSPSSTLPDPPVNDSLAPLKLSLILDDRPPPFPLIVSFPFERDF
jgi:hypothetical protein